MQRRTILALGLVSSALLIVAGGTAALLQPGLRAGVLTFKGREVFTAIARAILDKTLPADSAARTTELIDLLDRINGLVSALPPHAQTELSQLLSLLGSTAGRNTLAGLNSPWPEADTEQLQQALQGMRLSSLTLRQQAYAALHDITAGAYFSDPSSWPLLGYPGPLKI